MILDFEKHRRSMLRCKTEEELNAYFDLIPKRDASRNQLEALTSLRNAQRARIRVHNDPVLSGLFKERK